MKKLTLIYNRQENEAFQKNALILRSQYNERQINKPSIMRYALYQTDK